MGTTLESVIERELRRDIVRRMITDAHGRLLDIRTALFLYTTGGLYTAVSPRTWEGLSLPGKAEMHEAGIRVAQGIDGEAKPIPELDERIAQPLIGRLVRMKHGETTYRITDVGDTGWTLQVVQGSGSGKKVNRFVPTEKTGTVVFV